MERGWGFFPIWSWESWALSSAAIWRPGWASIFRACWVGSSRRSWGRLFCWSSYVSSSRRNKTNLAEKPMIQKKKIVVVMPAYNAEKTLKATYAEIPKDVVDTVILVDDARRDNTAQLSKKLGIKTIVHSANKGYGGNQKTCYRAALKAGADIVIMLHPDYQYTPKLIPVMAHMLAS